MDQSKGDTADSSVLFRYGGSTVQIHSRGMSPSDAANALRGTGRLIYMALQTLYGRDSRIKIEFVDVKRESLGFEFLPLVAAYASPLLTIATQSGVISTVRDTISESIKILEFIRGKAPKEIKSVGDNNLMIVNDLGESNTFNAPIFLLASGSDFGHAIKQATAPIGRSADYWAIREEGQESRRVHLHNAPFMRPIEADQDIENEFLNQVVLSVSSPILNKEGKWGFALGSINIRASIEDKEFLARVRAGEEKFGNGDRLIVLLKIAQKRVGKKIVNSYSIQKILGRG